MPIVPKNRLATITLLCFQVSFTLAQTGIALSSPLQLQPGQTVGSIQGEVRDAESGELLPLVNIRLADTLVGTSTEFDGAFELTGLQPGTYALLATYVGYEEQRLNDIEVLAGQRTIVAIALEPAAVIADEVVVTATLKPQAVKLAPASIGLITSKQIRERNITTFDQAFDEVPGVVVSRSSGANVQAFSIRGASEVAGGGIGNRRMLAQGEDDRLRQNLEAAAIDRAVGSSINEQEAVRVDVRKIGGADPARPDPLGGDFEHALLARR